MESFYLLVDGDGNVRIVKNYSTYSAIKSGTREIYEVVGSQIEFSPHQPVCDKHETTVGWSGCYQCKDELKVEAARKRKLKKTR